jgi:hypothetical protein
MTTERTNKRDGISRYGVMDESIKEIILPRRLKLCMR